MIVLAIFTPFTYNCYMFREYMRKSLPEGYDFPELKDFWFTIVIACFVTILEKASFAFFYEKYIPICKEKNDPEIIARRTAKGATNIFKCFYYTTTAIIGWYILKDSFLLPTSLGGNGDLNNMFLGFPFFKQPPGYKYYFTGTMGFHIAGLLKHLFAK
jgi:hypothetical protein